MENYTIIVVIRHIVIQVFAVSLSYNFGYNIMETELTLNIDNSMIRAVIIAIIIVIGIGIVVGAVHNYGNKGTLGVIILLLVYWLVKYLRRKERR